MSQVISQFYSRTLLSNNHKNELDTLMTNRAKAEYFLDKVIKPGLQIDYTKQFDEMLLIMRTSDDPPVKYLGDNIMIFMGQHWRELTSPAETSRLGMLCS